MWYDHPGRRQSPKSDGGMGARLKNAEGETHEENTLADCVQSYATFSKQKTLKTDINKET